MNTFREKVYIVAHTIPKGRVATYGQLAKMAGSPGAARAVGMCMKCNTDTKKVPCHRVVDSDGRLTGYAFGGESAKKKLLLKEGVVFIKDRVDLKKSGWKK